MRKKHNILFTLSAIALIFILLGMMPIKIGQKMAKNCPVSDGKSVRCSTACIFNAVTSQKQADDVVNAGSPPPPVDLDSTVLVSGTVTDTRGVFVSGFIAHTPPLRC